MPRSFWKRDVSGDTDLFVFPCVLKPGQHSYVIRFGYDKNEKPVYYYHTTLSDIRPEEIPSFVKTANKNRVIRRFDKEASVF